MFIRSCKFLLKYAAVFVQPSDDEVSSDISEEGNDAGASGDRKY